MRRAVLLQEQPSSSECHASMRATAMSKPAATGHDGLLTLTNLPSGGWLVEAELPQEPGALRPPTLYYPGVLLTGEASFVELVPGRTTDDVTIVAPRLADNKLTVRVVTLEQRSQTRRVVRAASSRWSAARSSSTQRDRRHSRHDRRALFPDGARPLRDRATGWRTTSLNLPTANRRSCSTCSRRRASPGASSARMAPRLPLTASCRRDLAS